MSSSSRNRRMSIHGGALRENPSRKNRRMSVAPGMAAVAASGTPLKDRRAKLDEYRHQQIQQKRSHDHVDENITNYRPILTSSIRVGKQQTEGPSALERFRLKKQQKLQQQYHTTAYSSNLSFDDEPTISIPSTHMNQSPLSRRYQEPRSETRSSSMTLLSAHQHESVEPLMSQETEGGMSHLSHENTIGSIETTARYEEMRRRLQKLEEEKMDITIAMAPMEARHRQKEEAWLKEQTRLLQEIEDLKSAGQEANERFRDLEAQHETKEQENRELRKQIRKESSTMHFGIDSNGEQMVEELVDLKKKYKSAVEDVSMMRMSRVSAEKALHATKIELESIAKAYEDLQEEYDLVSSETSNNQEAQIKLDVLTEEHIATSAQLNAVRSDLAAFKAAFDVQMTERNDMHQEEVARLQFELSVLKTRCAEEGVKRRTNIEGEVEDFAVLKARIEEKDRKIAELEKERVTWEGVRRQMHNRIQELRGNIRVFVRTRPFLPNDGAVTQSAIDVSRDGESLTIMDGRTGSPFDFKFDKIFAPSAGQDNVFDEVADFIQSALDGYNVCLFSYGQTGSGKTHTMQGSGNGAMRGIIPRAVEQILVQAQSMQVQGWSFSLSASFLEIYNEELKDLLIEMTGGSTKNPVKLNIKRSRAGKSFVENLSEVPIETRDTVSGMAQLDRLMKSAARSRSVASTKMNSQSSRSHSVFMLHLSGFNAENGTEVRGALNLCDLAGSERLDRSGAGTSSARLRETQAINKSLSCLGDVFNALAQKSNHIPFRNSKLTYLLQDCLSGDGKALMFVNLSPTCASSNESLCSLRFAQRVNQVELGKAKVQVTYNKR